MARSVIVATLSVVFIGALALATAPPSAAQGKPAAAPAAANAAAGATDSDPANATTGLTDAQLGDLVGRIALYPDDLLALILPASTVPLEIVQAQRFLKEAKGQKDPQPPESLSEPVRNLLNYSDIIDQMNSDLDWVQRLGEAVYDDQEGVMDAVQAFRMKAYSAGNLKSDDKQKVEVTEQTIVIEPAKPDVIYVPQYEPSTVIVAGAYPYHYGYWPTAYPSYYYPYPPGYAFASGLFWGATAAWAFNWAGGGIGWGGGDIDIDIDRNVNRNSNRNTNRSTDRSGNRGDGNRGSGNRGGGANSGTWNPKGKGGGQAGNRPTTRPGDAGFKPNTNKAGNRATAGTGNRAGAGASGGKGNFHAPSTRPASRPSGSSGSRPSTGSRPSSGSRPSTSNNAGLRSSSSAASRSSGSSRGSYGSRGSSPRSGSYGGMSGRQASAAGSRGSMSRGGGGGSRGGGGGRRR